MIKGLIQGKDIILVDVYAPNTGAPKYIKQIQTKWDIDNNTVTVGDFNTPLISMDGSHRQKINKAMVPLNDTIAQLDLRDICRHFI